MNSYTINDVKHAVRKIYRTGNPLRRFLLYERPSICPFHVLIDKVQHGSLILDIGCGTGLFLNLLAFQNRIAGGIGFDSNLKSIETAKKALAESKTEAKINFIHQSVESSWPKGIFDVVSMIDVLHHIDPGEQLNAIEQAVGRVKPGGVFLYKDIGTRSLWRAFANRLHDLFLARQWIHYVSAKQVVSWAENVGLTLQKHETINMLWFRHEMLIFYRPEENVPLKQE